MLFFKTLIFRAFLLFFFGLLTSDLSADEIKVDRLSGFRNLYKLNVNKISRKNHRIIGRIPGFGTVRFTLKRKKKYNSIQKIFSKNRLKKIKSNSQYYEVIGTILGKNINFPAHLSLYNNKILISFNNIKVNSVINKHYNLKLENNFLRIHRSTLKGIAGFCNVKNTGNTKINIFRSLKKQSTKELKIGIVSDEDWYKDFKDDSGNEMLRILSEVETIYQKQLKIKFKVKENIIYKDRTFGGRNNLNEVFAKDMLFDFKNKITKESYYNNADNFHLFSSAKTINPDNRSQKIIGLAFTGVICKSKSLSFGFTTRSNSSGSETPTFAHELGHNFNANHTNSGIMLANFDANNPQYEFSNLSLLEMNNFTNQYNLCLKVTDGSDSDTSNNSSNSEIPINLDVKLTRRGKIKILINLDENYPDCELKIKASTKRRRIARGRIIYLDKAIFSSTNLVAKFRRRARGRNLRKNQRIRYFLMSEISCPNDLSGKSNIVRFRPNRIRSKKVLNPRRWIKVFGKRIKNSIL